MGTNSNIIAKFIVSTGSAQQAVDDAIQTCLNCSRRGCACAREKRVREYPGAFWCSLLCEQKSCPWAGGPKDIFEKDTTLISKDAFKLNQNEIKHTPKKINLAKLLLFNFNERDFVLHQCVQKACLVGPLL